MGDLMTNPNLLSDWQSFYMIVGSSAGALIGLQFVVITLISEERHRTTAGTLSAFGTPTVVHFAAALVISAIMAAPWSSRVPLGVTLGVCGLGGLIYSAVVVHRARKQKGYTPVAQDWIWYAVLPFISYGTLTAAANVLPNNTGSALFMTAGVALALLLIGIHNSWDTVTHMVVTGPDSVVKKAKRRAST